MSYRINSIYDALDRGNPKLALRLCQTALQKQPTSNIVKALMALSYSRSEQSEAAIEVCQSIMKEDPPRFALDEGVVDTVNYVFRREGRFDMSAQLFNKVIECASNPSVDACIECFVANIQANSYEVLPRLALRLYKQTNQKKYMEWYSFALSLQASDSNDVVESTGLLTMALASLDKIAPTPMPSPIAEDRWATSARRGLYLGLFRIQLLTKLKRFDEAITVVESIDSTLITKQDRDLLIADLKSLGGCETQSIKFSDSDSLLSHIYDLIQQDAINRSSDACWIDKHLYSKYRSLVEEYMITNIDRSDLPVILSPLMALIEKDDEEYFQKIFATMVADVKMNSRGKRLVNLYKLMYGFGVKLNVSDLIEAAMSMVESEDCLDECSPGKQLLLLASIQLLEENHIVDALCVMSYGSGKFSHCSHFRLLECIVYGRVMGLSDRAIERFEALGIKNAQWRSLFWLIQPVVTNQYISPDKRDAISYSIHEFFERHELETKFNYKLLVEQGLYWMFEKWTNDEASASRLWMNCEKYWSEIIDDFQLTRQPIDFEVFQIPKIDFDYSPLLFISFQEIGSITSREFIAEQVEREKERPRCLGFQWPRPQRKIQPPGPKISPTSFLGRNLQPQKIESIVARQSICCALYAALNRMPEPTLPSNLPLTAKDKILLSLISIFVGIRDSTKVFDESIMTEIAEQVTKQFDSFISILHTTPGKTLTDICASILSICEGAGVILNGWIQSIIMMLEILASSLPKKSLERKCLKKIINGIAERCSKVIKALHESRGVVGELRKAGFSHPALNEYRVTVFEKQLISDIRGEIDLIKSGFKTVIDRINLGKV
jgi:tetratricopeptide (TPR) repeat protein